MLGVPPIYVSAICISRPIFHGAYFVFFITAVSLLFRNVSLTIQIANFCVSYIKYNSYFIENTVRLLCKDHLVDAVQWRTERGGGLGCSNPPPPEVPKVIQNRATLTPIVKTVKNC